MGQRTPGTEYREVMAKITLPVTGTAAQRRTALSANALDSGSVLIPAARGNTWFKFGDSNVDAAATTAATGCISEGGEVNVQIPQGATHVSILSEHTSDYTIPLNVIR